MRSINARFLFLQSVFHIMRLPVVAQHIKEDRGRKLLDFQYTAISIQIEVALKVNLILFDSYLFVFGRIALNIVYVHLKHFRLF